MARRQPRGDGTGNEETWSRRWSGHRASRVEVIRLTSQPGDRLSAKADAKGRLISLERSLAGIYLAEAPVARLGRADTQICFWPDLCTFLEPESAETRLARLQGAGVTVCAAYGIGRP